MPPDLYRAEQEVLQFCARFPLHDSYQLAAHVIRWRRGQLESIVRAAAAKGHVTEDDLREVAATIRTPLPNRNRL